MQTIFDRIGNFSRITSAMAVLALSAAYVAQWNRADGQAAPSTPPATAPAEARTMPTLFLAGDSTMAGGGGATRGWGNELAPFFDTSRVKIENHALAGRSTNTYLQDVRGWVTIKPHLQKGDFVFIQFGHNDDEGAAINVKRFRFTLSGTGDEAAVFEVLPGTQSAGGPVLSPGQKVTIHTFGYYIKQMITETQAAGATPIVLSPVPRNAWDNGKIVRGEERHGLWSEEVAKEMKVSFVNINETVAQVYDPLGIEKVKELFFTNMDNTHTSPGGAKVTAACGVLGLLDQKDCPLNAYLLPDAGDRAKAIHDAAAKGIAPAASPSDAPRGGRRGQ